MAAKEFGKSPCMAMNCKNNRTVTDSDNPQTNGSAAMLGNI